MDYETILKKLDEIDELLTADKNDVLYKRIVEALHTKLLVLKGYVMALNDMEVEHRGKG